MKRLGLDDKQLTPRTVLGRISWAKNHMLDPQELYLQSADPKTENIAHIFTRSTARSCAKPTPSTSTTCCSKPTRLLKPSPRCASITTAAFSIC